MLPAPPQYHHMPTYMPQWQSIQVVVVNIPAPIPQRPVKTMYSAKAPRIAPIAFSNPFYGP